MTLEKYFIDRRIWTLWWSSLAIKCILGAIIPLASDESYYWVWSQNLQLSYFDHPAMIAWLLKLGGPLSQWGSSVRLPGILMGQMTLLVWLQILRPLVEPKKIFWWLLLVLISPLLGIGSLIMTPDVPLVFFWTLSLYLFQRLLEKKESLTAAGLGLALGLGFCSKYHIVLFPPIAAIYLTYSKKWGLISRKSILLIVVTGLLGSLPVLIWNFSNDFASFKFQLHHGLGRDQWNPFWTYSYPIGQILLIFPIPFYFALKSYQDAKARLLYFFAMGPLIFFFLSSFKGVVEMNWPIVAYPAVYALSVVGAKSLRGLRWTIGIWIVLVGLVLSNAIVPWAPNPPEKLNELTYFKPTVEARLKYSPVYAESYQMASYLWFKTKTPTYKLYQMSRRDFYDELPQSKPTQFPFYIIMDKNASLPEWLLGEEFDIEKVEDLSEVFVVQKVSHKDSLQ